MQRLLVLAVIVSPATGLVVWRLSGESGAEPACPGNPNPPPRCTATPTVTASATPTPSPSETATATPTDSPTNRTCAQLLILKRTRSACVLQEGRGAVGVLRNQRWAD